MASDGDLETTLLAQIESDLAELAAHVDTWVKDRFLASDSATALNLEDVTGLIVWLRQWQQHFQEYRQAAGATAVVSTRLDQVNAEIETSISTFKQMAETLPL